ncbi:hypothetical protein SERLA73DRAFT_178197, partial [Serpula lacrymans var. lacrymans S7.3]|uniref:Uncharacterized protein n=2 Tax=Serpula lacrymans var. lacrymans TaxID=341189 RepID=F8NNJ3_SERL9
MYNGTLRHNPNGDHEGSTAGIPLLSSHLKARMRRTQVPSFTTTNGLLILQPNMTVSRSSIHSSPASRRASHRRDALIGYAETMSTMNDQNINNELTCGFLR